MKRKLLFGALAAALSANGQDSIKLELPQIKVNGFLDVFYAYDVNQPTGNQRQAFLYNHNRHNEVNINLALVRIAAIHKSYRANVGLQTGTYAADNYAAEPVMLRFIHEANAGVALGKRGNLWLDAGVFSSHLGFESALSMDNLTLTRSLVAENSPYFLSGAKLTYDPNSKLQVAAVACNGWQRIQRQSGNTLPGIGTQVNYHPNDNVQLNWSSYSGSEDPDSSRRMRYFNNLYGKFKFGQKIDFIAGFDVGVQQRSKRSSAFYTWYAPVAIVRYALNESWACALRGEYYADPQEIIITTGSPNGFVTSGASINIDYIPSANVMCRLEGRWLSSNDNIFYANPINVSENVTILASMAVRFNN